MSDRQDLHTRWLEGQCSNLWSLLNTQARRTLPGGLAVYLSAPDASAGKRNLRAANRGIARLSERCGRRAVEDAYRRDMSSVKDELQLRNLLCEVSASAAVASVASDLSLRPPTGNRHCDMRATIATHEVWIEVKQIEDLWLFDCSRPDERGRALSMRSYLQAGDTVDRPAAEILRSKLDGRAEGRPPDGVPEQLPDDKLGLLFLFYSGLTIDESHIRAALFGDGFLGMPDSSGQSVGLDDPKYALRHACNGLFALRRWQRVSACCWVYAMPSDPCQPFRVSRIWHNPLAKAPLPPEVAWALQRICQAKD